LDTHTHTHTYQTQHTHIHTDTNTRILRHTHTHTYSIIHIYYTHLFHTLGLREQLHAVAFLADRDDAGHLGHIALRHVEAGLVAPLAFVYAKPVVTVVVVVTCRGIE